MIFFSKRNNGSAQSSNTEGCVSIIGLFLVIGLIGGLAVLIYGLVKGHLSVTIIGGAVLGISVFLTIILALVFIYCLKNNNVDSNANEQRSTVNQRHHKKNRQHKHNRRIKQEQTSSNEITVISGTPKYDKYPQQQQWQSNEYDIRRISPPIQRNGLADSTNSGHGRQIPSSPSKISSFVVLNESNNSMNHQSSINANTKQKNFDRH